MNIKKLYRKRSHQPCNGPHRPVVSDVFPTQDNHLEGSKPALKLSFNSVGNCAVALHALPPKPVSHLTLETQERQHLNYSTKLFPRAHTNTPRHAGNRLPQPNRNCRRKPHWQSKKYRNVIMSNSISITPRMPLKAPTSPSRTGFSIYQLTGMFRRRNDHDQSTFPDTPIQYTLQQTIYRKTDGQTNRETDRCPLDEFSL